MATGGDDGDIAVDAVMDTPLDEQKEIEHEALEIPEQRRETPSACAAGNQEFKKKEQDDACIVYAAVDRDKALEVAQYLRNLEMKNGESPRISLYDIPKFGGSLIEKPEIMLDSCRIIFMLLTDNFKKDDVPKYLLGETVAGSRIEKTNSDPKKYCVRPLHTQPKKSRDYETPFGLKSICAFEVHSGCGGKRLQDLFNYNRGHQETVYCRDHQEGLNKFHKEDKNNSGLAETSLESEYATMGPSSTSPPIPVITKGNGEPAGNVVNTSNTPKPDKDISEACLTVSSESINPGDTSASTITTVMANEVQQNTLSEPRDPKTQRCPHLGSASPFQTADSAQDMASNKDGQLLSPLVHVSDITERTDRKLEIGEISKELPDDSHRAHITHQERGIITEPVMKTSEPGHLPTAVCSSSSSEDRSLFGPQSTKSDGYDTLKTPIQEEVGKKPTSAHLQADNIQVSPDQIVPAGQSGGIPSSTTYVFINDCSHIELSGDVHLVNVNTKSEGSDIAKQHHKPKAKKKHGSLALTSGIDRTGSSGSSKSSPSSTLDMSSTDMSPKPQAASTFKVTPRSGPGKSERDAREGTRCLCDVAEEDASRLPVVESRKNKISDVWSAQKGREVDQADKLKSSKDERKKKSQRKTICFPFPRLCHKKK